MSTAASADKIRAAIAASSKRKKLDQVLYMQTALESLRDGVAAREIYRERGMEKTTLHWAVSIAKREPSLVQRILDGELTISKARQIMTKGIMTDCPVCSGKGYIFRKYH